jgi:hypothetical protein
MRKIALSLGILLAATGAVLVPVTTADAATCSVVWGSLAKQAGTHTTGDITGVRTGRHDCYDRVVIDLDGPAAGYRVEYVSSLTADGSGQVVPVSGGAILKVVALAPAYNDNGSPTVDPNAVDAINVSGYQTLRDVAWAGSFEGQTTLGFGVRARLPFRVLTLAGQGQGSRLVIDIAHRW